jgi:hypothetical protein
LEGDVVDSSVTPHEVIIEEAGQKVYQQGIAKDFRVKGKGVVEFEEVVKVLFEKPNLNKLVHIKPLYLCAKIKGEETGKELVDNGTAVNTLPRNMLEVIEKTVEDLTPTRVVISGFSGKVLQAKRMIEVSFKLDSLTAQTMFFIVDTVPNYNVLLENDWIHVNDCIPSTLHQMLLVWNESKFEVVHTNKKPFVT